MICIASAISYADRAKKIQNKAVVNENPMEKLIRELKEENEKLKRAMEGGMMPSEGGGAIDPGGITCFRCNFICCNKFKQFYLHRYIKLVALASEVENNTYINKIRDNNSLKYLKFKYNYYYYRTRSIKKRDGRRN